MPNVAAADETVMVAEAVDPAATEDTVAVPVAGEPAPETTIENTPDEFVVPDVLSRVNCPPVVVTQEAVNGVFASPLPCAFLAIKEIVTGEVPSFGTLEPVDESTLNVEPAICTEICAVPPALAVIVAVRLAKLEVPDLNVKLAVPSVPVVTVGELTIPVSVDNAITMPESAAFDPSNAVTVIVVDPELSEGTLVEVADSCKEAAVVVATLPVLGAVPPSPQPASVTRAAANITRENRLICLLKF